MIVRRLAFALAVVLSVSAARADTLQAGLEAYARKNYKQAFILLLPAARDGNRDAQYLVGRMYEDGYGTERSYDQAAKWYRLSAEQGNPLAQHALAVFFAVGWGGPADAKQSLMWLKRSAEQDYYYAQSDLGSRYQTGRGVPRSDLQAYMWFDLALSAAPDAVKAVLTKARDNSGRRMTPEEVARAQELAVRCRQSHFKDCE